MEVCRTGERLQIRRPWRHIVSWIDGMICKEVENYRAVGEAEYIQRSVFKIYLSWHT